MNRKLSILIVPVLFLASCSLFQKNSYVGEWKLTLSGDYSSTFVFNIGEDSKILFTDSIVYQGNSYGAKFAGQISEEGKITCDISVQGMKVASLSGNVDYNKGEGSWNGTGMKGKWTALKK